MRRALLLFASITFLASWSLRPPVTSAQAPVKRGNLVFSTVTQWLSGQSEGILVSNNADGEIRLAEGRAQGTYTSAVSKIDFAANAVGAVWQAAAPEGTELRLEVRGGPGPAEEQLGDWQPLDSGDARSQNDDGAFATESVRPLPAGTLYLQIRASLATRVLNASPELNQITLSYLDAGSGPALSAGLPRVPAPYGPSTLTSPPLIIPRADWSGGAPSFQVVRQTPRGVVLHQIGADGLDNPTPFLRALASYHTEVLGWDDMAYHFVIDGAGNIYQGHVGGPTASIPRFAGGDDVVNIALLGSGAPSVSAQAALRDLLAWLGQAYAIPPLGQHSMVAGGASGTRPNVAAHNEVVAAAADPSSELRDQIGALRQAADQATVRARWYFAEGNTLNYAERLSVLNPTAGSATVRFRLLRQPGPTQESTVTVGANGRFDLVVNNIFSDTTEVPAIIESNAPVIAERFMDFQTDITSSTGISAPSRVWYFAEGSTDQNARTFLVLFNPQNDQVGATLTYMKGDGSTAQQDVQLPPQRRVVVAVGDALPNSGFGTRVIASQPIIAERTMIFGPGSTLDRGGVHTAPGVVKLSRRWYFAEGTTQPPFQMNIMVLNPNAQPANITVTFLNADGVPLARRYAVPPTTRLAINVNEFVPEIGVATVVDSDRPVVAERSMYWKDGAVGAVTAGVATPAFVWRFADGRTSGDFQEYLLFNNPNKNQARVTVDFIQANGATDQQSIVMPGGSRYTMAVHQLYPGQTAIGATVRSTQPIIVERSLYPGDPTGPNSRGGATSFGVPEQQP